MSLLRNTTKIPVDTYLGTSYDVVKNVYDNLANITAAAELYESTVAAAIAAGNYYSSSVETQTGADSSGNIFTLQNLIYTVGGNNLFVFKNGLKLIEGTEYTETSANSVTMVDSFNLIDTFHFVTNLVGINSTNATNSITHTENTVTRNLATYLQNKNVASIDMLLGLTVEDGDVVTVSGYHPDSVLGGGVFKYDSSMAQTDHNGITILAKDAVFPSDWTNATQLNTWFAGPGAGTGCFVKLNHNGMVSLYEAGLKPAGDMYKPLITTLDVNDIHTIFLPSGPFTLSADPMIAKAVEIVGGGGHMGVTNLAGAGFSTTAITCTAASGAGITLDSTLGGGNGVSNLHLSKFMLIGNANMDDGISVGASAVQYLTFSSLKNISIKDFTKVNALGVRFRHTLETYLENVFVFNCYDGFGCKSTDVATTIRTKNCYAGSCIRNGMRVDGGLSGSVFDSLVLESNYQEALYIGGGGAVFGLDFIGIYTEANTRTGGTAAVSIVGGTNTPIYINFFGGSIQEATPIVAGKYINLDKADRVNFYDVNLNSYTSGFMSVTANTTSSRFKTFANPPSTYVTGNHANGMYIEGTTPETTKIGTFDYDLSTASGTTVVTGLGFEPGVIEVLAAVDNTTVKSHGYSDGTLNYSVGDAHGVTANTHGPVSSVCIDLIVNGSDYVRGTIGSITHDGFTITWTKTGSPTGTAKVFYKAQR